MSLSSSFRWFKFLVFGREIRSRLILAGAARGLRMIIDPNAKTQRLLGLDEREIQRDFVACAKWAEVLVDVGASDAYYGLVFRKHNAQGEIHLVEANEEFQAIQRDHFLANFPDAPPICHASFVVSPEKQGDRCCVISRDLPVRGRRVFLKVDVDGWELDVLRSAEALFKDTPIRTIIETHSPELERDCLMFLRDRGFTAKVIPNADWRRWIPENRPAHNRWIYAENTPGSGRS